MLAAYDRSFTIHAGRFILFDSEPMEGSEAGQIDLIVEAILEVAREGISRGFFDRLISFGRDRVGPWDQ